MEPSIFPNGSAKLSISSKNSKRKMLSGQDSEPVREQDGQLLGSLTPVLDRLRPLASDSCKCHKHKFFEGCVVRKDPLVLGDLTQLAVVALHGVGGVYYAPYVFGVLEVRAEPFPVVTPALDDNRIVLAPLDFKVVKCLFCSIFVDRLIYEFQITHELFLVLAGNILDRVAYLVYDAELNRSLRKDTCYRIGEAL